MIDPGFVSAGHGRPSLVEPLTVPESCRLTIVRMMTSLVDHDADEPLRSRQEREIAFGHTLSEAEHDLAWEAFHFGRTLELAGIASTR